MPTRNPYNPCYSSRSVLASGPVFSGRTRRWRAPPAAPPPPCDYVVTGDITPDATGDYFQDGTYEGQPCYRRSDSAFWIWFWSYRAWWYISTTPGTTIPRWGRMFPTIAGDYNPVSPYTGIAYVEEP